MVLFDFPEIVFVFSFLLPRVIREVGSLINFAWSYISRKLDYVCLLFLALMENMKLNLGKQITGRQRYSFLCLLLSFKAMFQPGLHESLQPCSRAARKWRENEEMKRKRRGNGERMRKWRENEEINREWGNGKRMRKSTENEEMERGCLNKDILF